MPVFNFGQPEGGLIQTAFVTGNIQASMLEFTRTLGVGPWFLFENFELNELIYQAAPADFRVTLALANSGHMQFELIQPLDDKPSPYREMLRSKGMGLHHYGVGVTDFDAKRDSMREQGFEEVMSCSVSVGARAAYFDTSRAVMAMVELVEMTDAVEQLWSDIRHASIGWKGDEPVRTFT